MSASPAIPASDVLDTRRSATAPLALRSQIVLSWLGENPLVAPATGLMAGIWFDSVLPLPRLLVYVAVVAGGGYVWSARGRRARRYALAHVGLFITAVALGAALHDLAMRCWPADHVVHLCAAQPVSAHLTGTIVSPPQIRASSGGAISWYPDSPQTQFILAVETAEALAGNVAMQGLVSVYVREPALGLAAGDRVRITGDLRTVSPAANPGSIDWRLVNRRNGILVQMSCPRAADVQIVHPGASWWMSKLHRLRCRARAALLEDTFSGDVPGSGFLAAMVLGQRSAIDPALNEAFVRSGTVHYLSVSGAHVGMMVGAIWGLGFLCGLTRRQCAAWAMIAATAYAIAAEPSPPIFRAAIMTDLGCLALLVRRPVRIANSLALSVLIILAVQPTQLFNAGFQLSYLTLLSVIYAAPRLHATVLARWRQITRRDDPLLSPEIQRRIGMAQRRPWLDGGLHLLGWSLAIGAAAWVVGALLSAYHFQQLQMWGGLNSIVLVPLVWWVMVVGLVKTALGVVLPGPAGMLGGVLAIATRGLIRLVEAMAQLPGSGLPTPMLPTWVVVGCLLVVLLWIVRERLRLNDHAVRCSMLIAVIALAWTVAPRRAGDALQLHVLSVGNGTATVIELPNGKTLLYDIGSFPPFDLDRWAVGPLLARDRCPRVDAVVLSHANVDHYGGLFDLLNRREVACVITTPHLEHAATSATSRHLLEALDRRPLRRLHVDAGTRLSGTGSAAVEVLWPPKGELTPADTNDSSIVLRVSFAGTRILLCGDIEERAIESLLASTDLRADILLLPHHGSVVPGTPAFIRAVAPRCCIRSTGRRDTSEPLLQAVGGCQYFSTAQSGAVSVCVTAHDTIIQPCLPDARR